MPNTIRLCWLEGVERPNTIEIWAKVGDEVPKLTLLEQLGKKCQMRRSRLKLEVGSKINLIGIG